MSWFETWLWNLFTSILALSLPAVVDTAPLRVEPECPSYSYYSRDRHDGQLSTGRYQLPYQRPTKKCRTFTSPELEETIERLVGKIADPDLSRLFENAYPNTLDTAVRWTGFARDANNATTDEDLAFIITGDINAMWLRDSANQILSYLPLLTASSSPGSLAALFRGVINAQSRYIKITPYCHAFQPPWESQIPLESNHAYYRNTVYPPYNQQLTFDCKWELDSLASFLQISHDYFNRTGDIKPFRDYSWVETIRVILAAADGMRTGTYNEDGTIAPSGYTMTGQTDRATETTSNNGLGNPVTADTGLIRSTFRPSDDASIFQFLIPSNMMFAHYLQACASTIMPALLSSPPPPPKPLPPPSSTPTDQDQTLQTYNQTVPQIHNLTAWMQSMSDSITTGIRTHAQVAHPRLGTIYAFEVDGYGSQHLMDDANLPSLLSCPLTSPSICNAHSSIYQNTRLFALSSHNPYWMHGPVFSAVGGPHVGPTKGWPLASIVRILTVADEGDQGKEEVRRELRQLVGSTDGLGLMHESVNAHNEADWSRQWFGWANGMFGDMILKVERRWPDLLRGMYQ